MGRRMVLESVSSAAAICSPRWPGLRVTYSSRLCDSRSTSCEERRPRGPAEALPPETVTPLRARHALRVERASSRALRVVESSDSDSALSIERSAGVMYRNAGDFLALRCSARRLISWIRFSRSAINCSGDPRDLLELVATAIIRTKKDCSVGNGLGREIPQS